MSAVEVLIPQQKKSARKRENLDHLSEKERIQRRKITNRVSAQAARERKKVYVDQLESLVRQLQNENGKLKSRVGLLETRINIVREDNSRQRSTAARATTASARCDMPAVRGCLAAPAPVSDHDILDLEMPIMDIKTEPVECESAALDVSQPQKRCTSPTESMNHLNRMMLMMTCLSCLASPTSASQLGEVLASTPFSPQVETPLLSTPDCPSQTCPPSSRKAADLPTTFPSEMYGAIPLLFLIQTVVLSLYQNRRPQYCSSYWKGSSATNCFSRRLDPVGTIVLPGHNRISTLICC